MTINEEVRTANVDDQSGPLSKRELGREYRSEILWSLAKLGYASTRQLAAIVWNRCDQSTRKMATRSIGCLLDNKLVVERRDTVAGERLIALTKAGASRVSEWGMPLPRGRAHARDWLRHAHAHRTAANSIYAAAAQARSQLDVGWSELEIWAKVPPEDLCRHRYKLDGQECTKIPDVLLHGMNGRAPIWVEVENSWRSAQSLREVIAFIQTAYQIGMVSNILFAVTCPAAKTIGQRIRTALECPPVSGDEWRLWEVNKAILNSRFAVARALDPDTLTFSELPF